MAGAVSVFPGEPSNGDNVIPPGDIYRTAVEEYRFQAQFNWSRTQYLLGFNVAILAASTAVATRGGVSAALIFAFGIVGSAAAVLVVHTQHDYYRAARDHMRRTGDAYGVPPTERIDSTATLGARSRTLSVNRIVFLLLTGMAVANSVGAVLVLLS